MLEQKEETVKLKEEVENLQKQLKTEISRREEVSSFFYSSIKSLQEEIKFEFPARTTKAPKSKC